MKIPHPPKIQNTGIFTDYRYPIETLHTDTGKS